METKIEYRNCMISLSECTQEIAGSRSTHFVWRASHYGKELSQGSDRNKSIAYHNATVACDKHLDDPYRFEINFVGYGTEDGGDVITNDGEYLGIWKLDAEDHPSFIPDGSDEPLFHEIYLGLLVKRVAAWHSKHGK
jgi:hypothetical protein